MHAKQEEVGAAAVAANLVQGRAEEQAPAAALSQKQAASAGQAAQGREGLGEQVRLAALIHLDGKSARRRAVQRQQAQQPVSRSGRHCAAGGVNGRPAGGLERHALSAVCVSCTGCNYCRRAGALTRRRQRQRAAAAPPPAPAALGEGSDPLWNVCRCRWRGKGARRASGEEQLDRMADWVRAEFREALQTI